LSIKSKVIAAASALTLVSGIGVAGALAAGTASAATPSCGPLCADVFSWQFGSFHHPNFTLDVFRGGAKVGQPIILFRTSNSDGAEDFSAEFNGTTSSFYAAGLVSSLVALHYGCTGSIAVPGGQIPCAPGSHDTAAFEIEYAPYGANSGLCVGLASTAYGHEGVTLQGCGQTSRTVWIADTNDQRVITSAGIPLINGSDTNFSHPYVLTYPAAGYPTDKPRPQLFVSNLTGFTQPGGIFPVLGTVNSNQLWSAVLGVLP
jgi:hypothetical protein